MIHHILIKYYRNEQQLCYYNKVIQQLVGQCGAMPWHKPRAKIHTRRQYKAIIYKYLCICNRYWITLMFSFRFYSQLLRVPECDGLQIFVFPYSMELNRYLFIYLIHESCIGRFFFFLFFAHSFFPSLRLLNIITVIDILLEGVYSIHFIDKM